jgi:hypothetical protein
VAYTTMPFGKHKGEYLCEIPADYLRWVLLNCTRISAYLRQAIATELAGRGAPPPPGPTPPSNQVALTSALVRTWPREMIMRFHPDRGGSNEAMQAINHAHDRFRQLAALT